eukprot:4376528-Alexandrium_andersonii.AAC.1
MQVCRHTGSGTQLCPGPLSVHVFASASPSLWLAFAFAQVSALRLHRASRNALHAVFAFASC